MYTFFHQVFTKVFVNSLIKKFFLASNNNCDKSILMKNILIYKKIVKTEFWLIFSYSLFRRIEKNSIKECRQR